MPTVNTVNSAIPSLSKLLGNATTELIQEMTQELIDTTPRCTGYASASWYATPNAVKSKNEVAYPGDFVPCLGQIPHKTIDLSRYRQKVYADWNIVNLASYIGDLNEGSSKQQDVGWIEDIVTKYMLKGLNLT